MAAKALKTFPLRRRIHFTRIARATASEGQKRLVDAFIGAGFGREGDRKNLSEGPGLAFVAILY